MSRKNLSLLCPILVLFLISNWSMKEQFLNIDLTKKTVNFSDRPANKDVKYLILHYTAANYECSLNTLVRSQGKHQVSSHYLIDEDGYTHQLATHDKVTWHAGKSFWQGDKGINSLSIGIELVNPGDVKDCRPFSQDQLDSLATVSRSIIKEHKINPLNVLGHSDIAVGRKFDPGPLMNWRFLAKKGVGLMPPKVVPDNRPFDPDLFKAQLIKLGYQKRPAERMFKAFEFHWGGPDRATWNQKIEWLLQQKNKLTLPVN